LVGEEGEFLGHPAGEVDGIDLAGGDSIGVALVGLLGVRLDPHDRVDQLGDLAPPSADAFDSREDVGTGGDGSLSSG